jgi:hypothetical protein
VGVVCSVKSSLSLPSVPVIVIVADRQLWNLGLFVQLRRQSSRVEQMHAALDAWRDSMLIEKRSNTLFIGLLSFGLGLFVFTHR